MRSLLVVDAPARWSRLARLLADLGDVTIATANPDAVTKMSCSTASLPLPPDTRGWLAMTSDAEAIVHVGPSSRLTGVVEALASASARPRVLIAVASEVSDAAAVELVADGATRPDLRVCSARLGAWVGEDCGLVRALVPLYRCFVGLRELADDLPISWCHYYDVARAVLFAIQSPEMSGTFDLVTPEPARVRDLDEAISAALGQRPLLRASLAMAGRVIGERLEQELVFGSERFPEELARRGFAFVFPDIRSAVLDVLGRGLSEDRDR